MRRVEVQVPEGRSHRVMEIASDHEAISCFAMEGRHAGGESWTLVTLNVPNDQVGPLIWAVQDEVEDAQFVLPPQSVLPLEPPLSEVADKVRDVRYRSTMELVLGSLQSIGSWRGMLQYAFFSGVVAAYAVIFDATYLLVAAMLIAPMGAPAMVSAIGAAIGDWRMVGRGAVRFVAAILVLVACAALLGWAYGLSFSTSTMESITSLSAWGVLLAMVAGAAGAQSQVESDRSSLVTGTATGFLIAAALSPTAAVLGLALVLQRWSYVALMSFQLALQYVSIVGAGALLLVLLYGVRPDDPTHGRGSSRWRNAFIAVAFAGVLALTVFQLSSGVTYSKADHSRDVVELAQQAIADVPGVALVEASARFTRPDLTDGSAEAVMVDVVVEKRVAGLEDRALETAVREAVQARLRTGLGDVVPFVRVSVLPPHPRTP